MEKIIRFEPGFDKRNPDPNINYGIGGMKIRFVLKGEKGAMQFLIGTDWYPYSTQKEYLTRFPEKHDIQPSGWDIGYHSPIPMHEGQEPMSSECDILGGTCYYDGSGLAADRLIPAFLERGTDAVWEKLTEWYTDRFGDEADQP
jgi:hypothetical protein